MLNQTLFRRMFQEEWRMHTALFGKSRFAAFPLFVFAMSAVGVVLLGTTDIALEPLLLGLHILVALFGLQTGSIAFIGTDAMRNVLGETTYLIYSARTLPVSQKRLLGIFLLKDLIYYAVLFLLPITLGFLPVVLMTEYALTASSIVLLWLTLAATFMLGVGLTLIGVSLSTTIPFGKPLLGTVVAGVAATQYYGVPLIELTPYHLFSSPSPTAALTGLLPVVASLLIATIVFQTSERTASRTTSNKYSAIRNRSPGPAAPLVSKMFLGVSRSSGGLGKIIFSAGLLLLVTWFLLQLATDIVGLEPQPALAYGALLSLTSFTTYNWITQNDAPDDYLFYPLDVSDLFAAKQTLFVLFMIPVGVLFYGGMIAWNQSTLLMGGIGAVVFAGLSLYLLGLTVYLAGFSPNEFLFDTLLFMAFTVCVVVGMVPVLLIAFLFGPFTTMTTEPTLLGIIVLNVVLLGLVGVSLTTRATTKWTTHYNISN